MGHLCAAFGLMPIAGVGRRWGARRWQAEHVSDTAPDSELITIDDDGTTWQFDRSFLESNWTCIWGDGCKGILDRPSEDLMQGCCSLGAVLDPDEARMLSALAPMVSPERFQFHEEAERSGVFADPSGENGWHTRVVDDGCIFLNRPGFSGGAGCALHLEALANDERPIDWKPGVCWQLPVHIDWEPTGDDTETATMRPWKRADWGDHGKTMAWCCTEEPEAYRGDRQVIDTLADEIEEMVGTPVFVELQSRIRRGPGRSPDFSPR